MLKKISVGTLLVLLFVPGAYAQNHLADVAASTTPGHFGVVNVNGDSSGYSNSMLFTGGGGVGSIYGYATKGAYETCNGSDTVLFSGGEHGGTTKSIYYTVSTNHWTDGGNTPVALQWGHAYDSDAVQAAECTFYANATLQPTLRKASLTSAGGWVAAPNPINLNFYQTEPSVEYFPDITSLLWLQGGWLGGLGVLPNGGSQWSVALTSSQVSALQLRGALARYIPSDHSVLLFGGVNTDTTPATPSHAVYKYSSNGSVTRMNDMPAEIWIFPRHALAFVDPVSSDLIIINSVLQGNLETWTGEKHMWRRSASTDTWTQMDASVIPTSFWPNDPSSGSTFGVVTVADPVHGGTIFMSATTVNTSSVMFYKHAPGGGGNPPPSDFVNKCSTSSSLACYHFDSPSNIRQPIPQFPATAAAYPMRWGGWNGTGPCASVGFPSEGIFTNQRNAPNELNALVKVQHGVCYAPYIDTSTVFSGTGSLGIEVPSQADSGNGGWFDTVFQGSDIAQQVRLGPDTFPQVHIQFMYRSHNLVNNNFGGGFPNSFIKTMILCRVPVGLDFCGSDVSYASEPAIISAGFSGNRNGLIEAYTYAPDGNLSPTERSSGNNIILQTGDGCVYSGSDGYSYPPCVKFVDDTWQRVTLDQEIRPISVTAQVSGNVVGAGEISSIPSNIVVVGRKVFITGKGYFTVTQDLRSFNALRLDASPGDATGLTLYLSGAPNSTYKLTIDCTVVINNSDQIVAWDLPNSGWGEVRLQPHMTNKDPNAVHTPARVNYDELVISAQPISTGCSGGQQPSQQPPPPPQQQSLTISPSALPAGTQGVAYSATLTATGGTAPYTWTIESGSLPSGFKLSAGIISGTTNKTGTYSFTVRVNDSGTGSLSKAFSISINRKKG